MLKSVVTSLAAGIAILASAPAAAQQVPQGVFTPEMQHRPTNQTLQTEFDNRKLRSNMSDAAKSYVGAEDIAACLARRAKDQAGGLLGGSLMGDPNYDHIGDALTKRYRNCATNTSASTAMSISGALAEALLAKQAAALPDRATGVSQAAARSFYGDLTGMVTYDNIAGCLAVNSPGLVYKVIKTPVASPEETAALQTLYAQSPECKMSAPPASVDPVIQRGTLATALYKWTARAS